NKSREFFYLCFLRVYGRRWIILAIVALLNNSNTMSWIAFASIANHVDEFYRMNKAANWFSMVYLLCTIPVGIFAMWLGSRFGLQMTIQIAAWANAIGGLIRLSSSFAPVHYRFPVGIFGQAVAACAYPFIMFLPPKVAGTWFAENERTIATTIGIMSNPLGVLLANLISPQIVTNSSHVPIINIITFVPTFFACLLAVIFINRSQPKMPPSFSAAQNQMCFLPGLKSVITNKSYILLLVAIGGGMGMFNCLYTVMQQLLCASGYSNSFSGFCAALMIIGGVMGASLTGIIVDRTKLFEEILKIGMALAVICGLLFLQLTLHPGLSIALSIVSFVFGVFGLAIYPVALELASECTFPVSETTSTGLIVLSGQVQSIIFVALMQMTGQALQEEYMHIQVCTSGVDSVAATPQDSTYSIIVSFTVTVMLIVMFKPIYKRLLVEQGIKATNTTGIQLKEKIVEKKEGENDAKIVFSNDAKALLTDEIDVA
ncbi:unnamed protein product, partial [Dracunculus medinensis]|uniref:MFS domain-containing protein n=1 Tax=Dracunculus medinensis TaxID=318479 RepID=A0A0N4U647_DRAME